MPKLPGVLLKILVSYLRENLFSFLAKIACENCHNNGIIFENEISLKFADFHEIFELCDYEKMQFHGNASTTTSK